jgi:hypothetical protein
LFNSKKFKANEDISILYKQAFANSTPDRSLLGTTSSGGRNRANKNHHTKQMSKGGGSHRGASGGGPLTYRPVISEKAVEDLLPRFLE